MMLIALCVIVCFVGWLALRLYALRSRRREIDDLMSDHAPGDTVQVPSIHNPLNITEGQ